MPANTEDETVKPETTSAPSASHLSSSNTATLSPSWMPPKSPLPPHRLAKIANALGVATPLPAIHYPTMALSPPFSGLNRSHTDLSESLSSYRRSPTPSSPGGTFQPYTPTLSKFLLHVIPPTHLPHDAGEEDSEFTAFPSSVNGYHTQFRRGVLVPLYASLQLQLNAIAREYALPSTNGIILYLVSSARSTGRGGISNIDTEAEELGARLSEEIWKHLWTRVMKAEQRDDQFNSSPRIPQLPSSPADAPLRPFLSNATSTANGLLPHPSVPHLPPGTPTTPSTASDLRSFTKSAPPSILSQSDHDSQTETPDTSTGEESRANSLDLPGLHSNSMIPVLAKVEFDIDRRKAVWYERWLRSRKVNHAKRSESSRKNSVNRQASTHEESEQVEVVEGEEVEEKERERRKPISLLIGRKTASPVSFILSPADEGPSERENGEDVEDEASPEAKLEDELNEDENVEAMAEEGYEQLDENEELEEEVEVPIQEEEKLEKVVEEEVPIAEEEDANNESDDEFASEITARVTSVIKGKDPLADVFGTDEETWAEMQSFSRRTSKRQTNPNVVELALNAADLTRLPSPTQSEADYLEEREEEHGVDEVRALLEQVSNAQQRHSQGEQINEDEEEQQQEEELEDEEQEELDPNDEEEPEEEPTPAPSQAAKLPERNSSLSYRSMSSTTSLANGGRKHIPAPLVLVPAKSTMQELDIPTEPSPLASSNASIRLAYLRGESVDDILSPGRVSEGEEFDDAVMLRTPASYERREAVAWDEDLELDLSPAVEEFDEDDPNDHRRSQVMMKAQLDEIERTMASLSPQNFQAELEEPQQKSPMGMSLSPNNSISRSPGLLNRDVFPPSPSPSSLEHNERSSPVKHVNFANDPTKIPLNGSPPKVTINKPTTSTPRSSNDLPENSIPQPLRPALKTPASTLAAAESPIIPLSPDPFGRFSSDPPGQSVAYWDNPPNTVHILPKDDTTSRSHSRATSRFSLDSATGEEPKEVVKIEKVEQKASFVSVSSFKKFWKRGTKTTPAATPSATPPPSGPASRAPSPPQLSRRPSQDPPEMAPRTSNLGQIPNQLLPSRPSQERDLSTNAAQRGDEPPKTPASGQFPNFPGSSGPPRSPPQPPMQQSPQLVLPEQPQDRPSGSPTQPGYDLYTGPLVGSGPNMQPIHAAHMQRVRKNSTMQGAELGQEVPYPEHRSPLIARAQLPAMSPGPSPNPSLPGQQVQPSGSNPYLTSSGSEPPTSPQPPASPNPEKPSLRKSILKSWKSSTSLNTAAAQQEAPQARPMPGRPSISIDRPPSITGRPRKASLTHSTKSSISAPIDYPPSPQIPRQFLQHGRRPSERSRLTGSSIDSSQSLGLSASPGGDSGALRRSVASSQSRDSRSSSFDASQFEIVSPQPLVTPPSHQTEHQH